MSAPATFCNLPNWRRLRNGTRTATPPPSSPEQPTTPVKEHPVQSTPSNRGTREYIATSPKLEKPVRTFSWFHVGALTQGIWEPASGLLQAAPAARTRSRVPPCTPYYRTCGFGGATSFHAAFWFLAQVVWDALISYSGDVQEESHAALRNLSSFRGRSRGASAVGDAHRSTTGHWIPQHPRRQRRPRVRAEQRLDCRFPAARDLAPPFLLPSSYDDNRLNCGALCEKDQCSFSQYDQFYHNREKDTDFYCATANNLTKY
ncbi:hypothetical protein B0H14DRAFT_2637454 [Mycena olivaceomarginata]|nr:hypothetical protein B0H14DRAFT_2637454 [Mycena olivaceomarginata]